MVQVCLRMSVCSGRIGESMIKSEGEAGNDARLQKDKLLVVLIFTALTTKNGLRSEASKGWG